MRESISSNHFSVDQQAADAMRWLLHNAPGQFAAVLVEFPEYHWVKWELSHFDTDAMGVHDEWGSWLVDAIEATGLVWWEDGEPWIGSDHLDGCEDDDCEGCDIGY